MNKSYLRIHSLNLPLTTVDIPAYLELREGKWWFVC